MEFSKQKKKEWGLRFAKLGLTILYTCVILYIPHIFQMFPNPLLTRQFILFGSITGAILIWSGMILIATYGSKK